MAKILVIDLGTSWFKFALFDRAGQLCGLVQREPSIRRPEVGHVELAADDFVPVIAEQWVRLGQVFRPDPRRHRLYQELQSNAPA